LIFRIRTLPRSEEADTFDDEIPQPPISNLTAHTNSHSEQIKAGSQDPSSSASFGQASSTTIPPDHGYTPASAKIMEDFLLEGKLNPKIEPTCAGFLKIFAAWLLEEDLPFTMGESPGIKWLFEDLHVKYQLSSDTTVCNQLAHIFLTLHATVVEELLVSLINARKSKLVN
jgi:hypothetical protein